MKKENKVTKKCVHLEALQPEKCTHYPSTKHVETVALLSKYHVT